MTSLKPTYTYCCPVCCKRIRFDTPGEPCCTGPSESRDDHEMTVMHLEKKDRTEINPAFAAMRAAGPLILSEDLLP